MARDPISSCLAGEISPEVAVARATLNGMPAETLAARIFALEAAENPHWHCLMELVVRRPAGIATLSRMLAAAGIDHRSASSVDCADTVRRIAAAFDRAVAIAPESSVAAFSLGDPAILAAGTAEIVSWLMESALLGPASDVLDFGCGIGRIAGPVADHARSVMAIDVSAQMIDVARHRCRDHRNLAFAVVTGLDLAGFGTRSFDLVLAVDSFPYLVQAGAEPAESMFAEMLRVLRPDGACVILNLAYEGDAASHAAVASRWADANGARLTICGARPFTLWDGAAYVWRR